MVSFHISTVVLVWLQVLLTVFGYYSQAIPQNSQWGRDIRVSAAPTGNTVVTRLPIVIATTTTLPTTTTATETTTTTEEATGDVCNTPNSFRCARETGDCVKYEQLCDGVAQCPNGADETGLVCALRTCDADSYDCGFGGVPYARCVPRSKVCDRHQDCLNKADESNCTTPRCHDDQFECVSDHHCISTKWRCDTIADCEDTSDEQGCMQKGNEEKSQRCQNDIAETFHCDKGTTIAVHEEKVMDKLYGDNCIPFWYVCNGQIDCKDGADERNCVARGPPNDKGL